jgi:hypothetical protein
MTLLFSEMTLFDVALGALFWAGVFVFWLARRLWSARRLKASTTV